MADEEEKYLLNEWNFRSGETNWHNFSMLWALTSVKPSQYGPTVLSPTELLHLTEHLKISDHSSLTSVQNIEKTYKLVSQYSANFKGHHVVCMWRVPYLCCGAFSFSGKICLYLYLIYSVMSRFSFKQTECLTGQCLICTLFGLEVIPFQKTTNNKKNNSFT